MAESYIMNYARCRCFLESNVYLKSFGLHVSFKSEKQFEDCYRKKLSEMGCTDLRPVIHEIKEELERRRRIPYDSVERTIYIKTNYKPLHPDIFELKDEFLHPDVLDLLHYVKEKSIDKAALGIPYRTHGVDVFSFPIFSLEFCNRLVSEIDHFNETSMPKGRPNSMNNYGVLLDELGLNEGLLTPLRKKYLEPISQFLFPEEKGMEFDSHKVFTVNYEENKDTELAFHFDNSEVTLNVCLLENCEGGELFFGAPGSDKGFGYIHEAGMAVIHRGSALHCVLPLLSGRRVNLVMWMRSSSVRNLTCPMCGKTPDLEPVENGWGDGFTIPNKQPANERT
ncbi:2-oxoglutarate and iron-dependent oxygenase domain-containing protein 2 [Daphnia magna]|uniref:2-oxoglutarate and iron-dependent oxygenase domain-containing protein 2 n=1 Tax=Daphnia magna TaxID=35525 RepID=A0A164Q8X2_9CRUS|nr:2-oxoglutarate and iron-dependent oxygenase domain-containing protein 2 [Daphnia magna]